MLTSVNREEDGRENVDDHHGVDGQSIIRVQQHGNENAECKQTCDYRARHAERAGERTLDIRHLLPEDHIGNHLQQICQHRTPHSDVQHHRTGAITAVRDDEQGCETDDRADDQTPVRRLLLTGQRQERRIIARTGQ